MLGHREPPCSLFSPQTCLTLACSPGLCPQRSPSSSRQHSFLPVQETFSDTSVLFPRPQGGQASRSGCVALPGRVLRPKGSDGVCDFKLPVSILQETRAPLKRDVAFLECRQRLPTSGASIGSSSILPEEAHQRWVRGCPPGAHFNKWSAASCPHV